MNKRRQMFFLVLGLSLGLLVTACAGVAVSDGQGLAGPSLFGPSFDTLSLPALDLSPAAEARPMQSMGLARSADLVTEAAAQHAIQQAAQSSMWDGPGCERHGAYIEYGFDD
jgi:hypothetical protein